MVGVLLNHCASDPGSRWRDDADVYRERREALQRISMGRDWSDWQKVGVA
jgi:hypothetical protein